MHTVLVKKNRAVARTYLLFLGVNASTKNRLVFPMKYLIYFLIGSTFIKSTVYFLRRGEVGSVCKTV